ncbi:winged helix-turn-helix transcriptional regulator [Aquabacter sp. P-9]|uniref:winged helix-turn-helix transcriptional regulator n=1 Tax=Aquabacter sediminis TaxID=3029197 RepID=UPI00237EA00E|nr:helix-turn-helix domain-containing protein [Aquabacter sp. P-9]MDE1568392.1 helix-turn-helix domain-containing protein [Aquabacter sp. P-9]
MARRHEALDCPGCPVEVALEMIGGKWKGSILFHLATGEKRHSQLRRAMGHVSQRILTKALRELEADGIVARSVVPTTPPQVSYALSPTGETLREALAALARWGGDMMAARAAASQERLPEAAE